MNTASKPIDQLRLIPAGRVSSDEQARDEKTSLEEQIKRTTAYIVGTLSATALEPITDDCSGELPLSARPGGKRILALLESDVADGVVFMNASRYFRDDLEGRLQARRWIGQGKRLFLSDHGEVKDDSEIAFLLKSWQASQERRDIADRTTRGRRNAANNGRVVAARVPFWLNKTFSANERAKADVRRTLWKTSIKLDKRGARLIRQMWSWLVEEKLSGNGIVNRLNGRGIPSPTGKKWLKSTVIRCLTNPALIGQLRYGEFEVKRDRATHKRIYRKRPEGDENVYSVPCPAVLTVDEFKRGLAQFQVNAEMNPRNVRRFYLLRSFVHCPMCKRRMVGQTFSAKRKTHIHETRVYQCPVCKKSVVANALEAWAWGEMARLMADGDEFEAALQEAHEAEQAERQPMRQRLNDAKALMNDLERDAIEIGKALRGAKGIVSRKLQEQQDALNEQYAKAEAFAKMLGDELANALTMANMDDIRQFRLDNMDGVLTASDEDKRHYLMTMGIRIEVTPTQVTLAFTVMGKKASISRDELRSQHHVVRQYQAIV